MLDVRWLAPALGLLGVARRAKTEVSLGNARFQLASDWERQRPVVIKQLPAELFTATKLHSAIVLSLQGTAKADTQPLLTHLTNQE